MADLDLATGTFEYGAPFSDGLYIVTTTGAEMTAIYE